MIKVNPQVLVDLFSELAKINAVSYKERALADYIKKRLKSSGCSVIEDKTGETTEGNCGNLICLPKKTQENAKKIGLLSHMDTISPTEGLKLVIDSKRIRSDGATIAGIDNRAGVAVLIYLLEEISKRSLSHKDFAAIFTVAEELDLGGAENLDFEKFGIEMAVAFDCSKRPGYFISSCAGCCEFEAKFHGKSSHAGTAPEKGINSIVIAGKAISSTKFGRLGRTTTSNIGKILGGTKTNVVPEETIVQGEVRAKSLNDIQKRLKIIREAFKKAAERMSGKLEFETTLSFAPFDILPKSTVYQHVDKAIRNVNIQPKPIFYTGGSDANPLNHRGLPTINIGIGAQNPHSNEETILIEDFIKDVQIAYELIKE
jgi:tripeptide aminopeptidase